MQVRGTRKSTLAFWLLATCCLAGSAFADENEDVRMLSDWPESNMPVRVDCDKIPITGDGFGGAGLACEERLSLYATFNCFPMKREEIAHSCPDWDGLQADIDWQTVSDLIDARDAESESKKRELERRAAEYQEESGSDH